MYYSYILQLRDGSYYVGSTGNLAERLKIHNEGMVSSTKRKLPATLIHREPYPDRRAAQSREYQIKKWKSRGAIERLIKNK